MKSSLFILMYSAPIFSALATSPTSNASLQYQEQDLEVITVTSQRIIRPIVEVANNLTLIDNTVINDLNLTDLNELLNIVPNVSMQSLLGDYDYIQMRGMPRNLEQATVGIYIDGVPYSSIYGLNINLLDIKSVEVLRGPQGNLYGKNTRDGVIAINTNQIEDELTGTFTLGRANFNQNLIETNASIPLISDTLALNFAGQALTRDGFVENTYLNDEIDEISQHNARLSLTWHLTNALSMNLTGHHAKKDNGSYPFVNSSYRNTKNEKLTAALDTNNQFTQDINNISLFINWIINEKWQLSAINSWDKTDSFGRFDADFSVQPFGYQDTWLKEQEHYHELRISSFPRQGNIDYLFGVSFTKSEDDNNNEWLAGFNSIEGKIYKSSFITYSDITWHLANNWRIQSGLRWLNEEITVESTFNNPYFPIPTEKTSGSTSHRNSQWLGKFAINKLLSDKQNIYLSWGQGYLSGGASWIAESSDHQGSRLGHGLTYHPENSNTLELGYKASFIEESIKLDIVVFNGKITDYQHASIDATGASRIYSIKEVSSQGMEASVKVNISSNFDWLTSIGYNNTRIEKISNLPTQNILIGLKEGQRIPYAPNYNFHTHINYYALLNKQWSINSNISWQRFGTSTFDFSGINEQTPYNLLNANITLHYSNNWKISLWAKNLTNEQYKNYSIDLGASALDHYGNPRQFGLDFSWSY